MAGTRTRRTRAAAAEDAEEKKEDVKTEISPTSIIASSFMFKGVQYESYQEMVHAKRNFNNEMLKKSGLLEASASFRENVSDKKPQASQRGLRADRKRKEATVPNVRRKSSRLQGIQSDGIYIEEERAGGKYVIAGGNGNMDVQSSKVFVEEEKPEFYNGRVNDGSDFMIKDAVENCAPKWQSESSVSKADDFLSGSLFNVVQEYSSSKKTKKSKGSLESQVANLNVDSEECVAKVVPERIYSVALHPSEHKIIAATGDKKGYLGLWDVDAKSKDSDSDGVYLFKPHSGAINNLEWNKSGTNLLSLAYDGTIRIFDVQKQCFRQAFGAYDESPEYKGQIGYGMDEGYRFYTQYACYDHRNEECLFLSTSLGGVAHLDLRANKATFDLALSEKKINTVSLHPNGNILATCGLDCETNLWDVRKFASLKSGSKVKPVATHRNNLSINSAFFSPSGKNLLTTTMSNTLDIFSDAHLQKGTIKKPKHRIRHDNRTGRWLSTFMAQWHPTSHEDLFIVGSMSKPRRMEFFNGESGELLSGLSGEVLTAVVSRCCFHPSSTSLIAIGGNSSGRVTVAR